MATPAEKVLLFVPSIKKPCFWNIVPVSVVSQHVTLFDSSFKSKLSLRDIMRELGELALRFQSDVI